MSDRVQVHVKGVQMIDGTSSVIVHLKDNKDTEAFKSFVDDFDQGKEYAAVFGEQRKKRSMDANAYAWVLLGKLAEKLGKPSVEIYREMVHDVPGSATVMAAPEEVFRFMKPNWESKGLGWFCEKIDDATMPGQVVFRCIKGSSQYDTRQMHRLIDLIIQECQQQGIQTATPEELARMKGLVEDG